MKKIYNGGRRTMPKMDASVRREIVLSMYMSVEALLLEPSSTAAGEASRHMAIMAAAIDSYSDVRIGLRTDPASMAVVSACNALTAIDQRHDRTGKWGMSGDEASALRSAMARFDEAMLDIPWPIYAAARDFVDNELTKATSGQSNFVKEVEYGISD